MIQPKAATEMKNDLLMIDSATRMAMACWRFVFFSLAIICAGAGIFTDARHQLGLSAICWVFFAMLHFDYRRMKKNI